MAEILLLKYGEMALKGLNKNSFEEALIRNIKRRIKELGPAEIKKAQSTLYITPLSQDYPVSECIERVKKIFGISMIHRAVHVEKNWDDIVEKGSRYLRDALENAGTFKVIARRSDKSFPMKSPRSCWRENHG